MKEMGESPAVSGSKRNRDLSGAASAEDEAYLDNFHSHKRYLSEIMASSLNGLRVGESATAAGSDSLILESSPAYISYLTRDDISLQYSPMSEDTDDARYSEIPPNHSMVPSDCLPTSPSSPHRHQRPLNGTTFTTSFPSLSCNLTAAACCQPRQRGSDSEGRFPSSPSDICHSADLRRAALLRSVQMRVQPPVPPSYDLPLSPEQESMQNMEAEDLPCLCRKSVGDDECGCQNEQQIPNMFEECSSAKVSESEPSGDKPCGILHDNVEEEACGRGDFGKRDILSSRRSILGVNTESRVVRNKLRDSSV